MSTAVPSNKMERGSDALKAHVSAANFLSIRQQRKGWFQECLGCEAKDEYKFFKEGEQDEFATALEESGFCIRCCCSPCHPFKMSVVEKGTNAELLSVDRPCSCPIGGCKCCCFQTMSVTSAGQPVGSIEEKCFCCVPRFMAYDGSGNELYKMHQPTCVSIAVLREIHVARGVARLRSVSTRLIRIRLTVMLRILEASSRNQRVWQLKSLRARMHLTLSSPMELVLTRRHC
mmetsp:Transcript_15615/g.33731  ORF Transcript_15615/g.33731 Transcript_15615/m.33731 type:complete len:231 (+) Transcript_15615:116-808(+)